MRGLVQSLYYSLALGSILHAEADAGTFRSARCELPRCQARSGASLRSAGATGRTFAVDMPKMPKRLLQKICIKQ